MNSSNYNLNDIARGLGMPILLLAMLAMMLVPSLNRSWVSAAGLFFS